MNWDQVRVWVAGLIMALISSVSFADVAPDFSKMDASQLQIESETSAIAQRVLARRMLGLDDTGERVSRIIENEQMQSAIDLLRTASTSDAVAANTLGTLMQNGLVEPAYESETRDLFKFAADRGNEGGQVNLAILKLFSGNSIEASSGKQVLENLIKNSNSDWAFVALRSVSTAMLYGIGGERDIAKGLEGYELFLQFSPNDYSILRVLGQAKEYGWVGEKDIRAAISFYERAVEGGSSAAMWQLAMIYQNSDGVEQDMGKAWDLVVQSSDAGYEKAIISRAVMLALGQGVDQDYAASSLWYEKAASNGSAHAIRSLAYMYQVGQSQKVNAELAWGLYSLTAPFDPIAKDRLDEMQLVVDQLEESEKSAFLAAADQQANNWLLAHDLTVEDIR